MNKLSVKEHTKKDEKRSFFGHKMASEKWDTLAGLADIVCTDVEIALLCSTYI